MPSENEIKGFFDFVKLRECDINFENPLVKIWFKDAYDNVELYIKEIRPYLAHNIYLKLLYNLWLHEYIVSGFDNEIYERYDIDSKAMIISSASNSGSSTSIQNFKSLDEGRFMLMDLWRTPYGRVAYTILESLQGIAIAVL